MARQYTFFGYPFLIREDVISAGPGGRVWESSPRLARYFESSDFSPGHFIGKRVIELGAGTGLCGIVCACLGAEVIVTDKASVLDNLRYNIALNIPHHTNVRVEELVWGENVTRFMQGDEGHDRSADSQVHGALDYVIASDVVYHTSLFEPLITTLRDLCGPTTVVILAHETRDVDETAFFAGLREHFECEAVPSSLWSNAGDALQSGASIADLGSSNDTEHACILRLRKIMR